VADSGMVIIDSLVQELNNALSNGIADSFVNNMFAVVLLRRRKGRLYYRLSVHIVLHITKTVSFI